MKIKIKEIYLYPLGAISKFYMDLNIASWKELLILIGGPLFQQIAYFFLLFLFPNKRELVSFYHYHILAFNLLPIVPLDGGKIGCLLLEKIFPYKLSKEIMIFASFIFITMIFFYKPTFYKIITCFVLLFLVIKEYRRFSITYHHFLLERYLNNYYFKKRKIIHSEKDFWRDTCHVIEKEKTYYLEKDYLEKKYQKKGKSY